MIGFAVLVGQMMNFSINVFHQLRTIFVEKRMGINVLIGVFFIRNLFEIVYIQLTNERGQV